MKLALRTRHEHVFQLNENNTMYIKPAALRGTPVTRITESSSYWERDWLSLDKYLEAEETELELKAEFGRRVAREGITSKEHPVKKEHKLHMDNCSKHIKIREIFGNGTYHPNQLVAKWHLPIGGLCEQELMYKIACKVSDLQVLRSKGELTMDPFEFYRFQIANQIEKNLSHPGQSARGFIKTIIRTLGDDDTKGGRFQDSTFRTIVTRAALYTGRSNHYGSKNSKKPGQIYRNFATPYRRRNPPVLPRMSPDAKRERRRKKLSKRDEEPSIYTGVNAYRSSKK